MTGCLLEFLTLVSQKTKSGHQSFKWHWRFYLWWVG